MEIKKIAEGAYFVPTYYAPVIEAYLPGIVNQNISTAGVELELEDLPQEEFPTQEDIERALKKVKPSVQA